MSPPTHPLPVPADIKLIVSDVDGTLLDSHHTLPLTNPTYKTLRRLRTTYPTLPIVLSTGKQLPAVRSLRSLLDLDPFPSIHLNGSILYTPTGTPISTAHLPPATVDAVYTHLQTLSPPPALFLYDHNTVYQVLGSATDEWAAALRGYGEDVRDHTACTHPRDVVAEVVKMAICADEAALGGIRAGLRDDGTFAVVQALTFCAELIPSGRDKGTALAEICRWFSEGGYEVGEEQCLVFGDGENDIAMARRAGMSVAMGNAMRSLKDVATWTSDVTSDEGAVGRFLEAVYFPGAEGM